MLVSKRVYYSGRVQGVGFRYTALDIARGFPVTGFVRNLSDGRVELVAEGSAADVDAFLSALAGQMSGYIQNQHVSDQAPEGHVEFSIRP